MNIEFENYYVRNTKPGDLLVGGNVSSKIIRNSINLSSCMPKILTTFLSKLPVFRFVIFDIPKQQNI